MKLRGKLFAWVALVVLLITGYCVYRIGWGKPFTINQLANRQAFLALVRNPELFTEVGIVDGTILDWHSGKLTPLGVKKRDDDYAMFERFAAQVHEFDRATLDRQDQITYDVLLDQYETPLAFRRFGWLSSGDLSPTLYPIAPNNGTQLTLPTFLLSYHIVKNEKTARNYVKRLEAMNDKLDAATAEMQWQARLGVVLPLSLLEKAEVGIKDTVAPAPKDNALVTTFVERMQKVKGLDPAVQASLAHDATAALQDRVYPAYARMITALEAERAAAATQSAGVGRLPDGAAYYALTLKQMTTTDYTPEQVHVLGLQEVARVTLEADTLLKSQGLTTGTVGERMEALRKDPRFVLPNTENGRRQLLTRYQQLLDEVGARMPNYFRTLPPTQLTVQRVPIAAEKGAPGAYYLEAAMDGSRPGAFFVNLRDPSETATWQMNTIAYHEGIPGHHFQISIAQSLKGLPLIRQQPVYAAYAEGWALYAEQLAAEIGMYKDDRFGNLGRLQAELFRAARLVVDTGLHSKGWTREQAIDYMTNTTGMAQSEVTTEVERYMDDPGQACAYKIGQLKILELRERAKAALGPRFTLKDFHAVVLENGALPLTLLEKLVDEWIAKNSGN